MCRLFGLTTGGPRVQTAFWLLDAPDSLRSQSLRMPDGAGIGWFSLGDEPVRDRSPIAAHDSTDFDLLARNIVSHTFVAHVRYSSGTALDVHNTHPFDMNDRLFAHNGVVRGMDVLSTWLSDVDKALIEGATDSELVFAYITAEIRRLGDTTAGLISAVRRIGAELPVYSLNILLAEANRLWALRYPETHELWVLHPEVGGFAGTRRLAPVAEPGRMEISGTDASAPAFVVASERMDDDPDWRLLEPGELLVIDGLDATSHHPFDKPATILTRADLSGNELRSQEPVTTTA